MDTLKKITQFLINELNDMQYVTPMEIIKGIIGIAIFQPIVWFIMWLKYGPFPEYSNNVTTATGTVFNWGALIIYIILTSISISIIALYLGKEE